MRFKWWKKKKKQKKLTAALGAEASEEFDVGLAELDNLASGDNWRQSIRKSLARRLSLRRSQKEKEDTLSNEIVQYRGISLEVLKQIRNGILDGTEGRGVQLFVVVNETEGLPIGRTVEFTGRKGVEEGEFMARVPFMEDRLVLKDCDVEEKRREDWSIEDVCEFVVLPDTLRDDQFYLDTIGEDAVGSPFRGAFVSQARKSNFSALVNALEEHYEGKDPSQVFLWIDIFCANQPLLTRKDRGLSESVRKERWTLLNSGLHDAIKNFDERLIFFNSWDNPYPLQRAWCIWEIYGAAISKKSMSLIFDDSASQDAVRKLLQDSGSLLQAIVDLDPRKMQCHDSADLEMIRSAVEQLQGGFSGLKATITARLRRWLLSTVENAVKQRGKNEASGESNDFGQLLVSAGKFMAELDENGVAISYFAKARKVFRTVHGTSKHEDVAMVLSQMADVFDSQGKFDEAIQLYKNALSIQKALYGEEHTAVAATYNEMADVYENQGKFDTAMELLEKALHIREALVGEDHLDTADTYNDMADVYEGQGKYDLALEMYSKALEIKTRLLGDQHESIADSLGDIASVYKLQGDYDKAMEVYEKALELQKETLGEGDPALADTMEEMGSVYELQDKFEMALAMYEKALEVRKETLGELHSSTADTYGSLAGVYRIQARYDMALKMLDKALRIRKETLGPEHPETAETYDRMGDVHVQFDNLTIALVMHEKAFRMNLEALGEYHPQTARTLERKGWVYEKQGEHGFALEMFSRALSAKKKSLGERHPSVAETLLGLADVLQGQGESQQAVNVCLEALSIRQEALGHEHPLVGEALVQLGIVYASQGMLEEAFQSMEQALACQQASSGRTGLSLAKTYLEMGAVLEKQGDNEAACEKYSLASEILARIFDATHPLVLRASHGVERTS